MTLNRTLDDVPLKYLIPLLIGIGFVYVLLIFFSPKSALAIGIMTVGFSMVWKTIWWIETFGRNAWAERNLTSGLGAGGGGSWLFYKLLGILIMVGAMLYWIGSLQVMLINILGAFFGANEYNQ